MSEEVTLEKLDSLKVLVAVTGGIGAYKICSLVSRLVQSGAEVQVAMTEMGTRFVGSLTFEALTGKRVILDTDGEGGDAMEHIQAARWAEVMLVAPCTANTMAKIAHGIGDDVVSTLSLAFKGKQILAPAMNPEMWQKPSTLRNRDQLIADGFVVIDPAEGLMACGDTGVGRLPEEEVLLKALSDTRS
jgi:phosphopantothenoylcysteine decarboxylase / phosphopantothenate---cysteine ligase